MDGTNRSMRPVMGRLVYDRYTRAMQAADARKDEIRRRVAKADADPFPELDVTDEDKARLVVPAATFVIDILYLAHMLQTSLAGWLDETSSNRILVLRRLALLYPQVSGPDELSESLGVTKQCMSVLLGKMKNEDLVAERRNPIDWRHKNFRLTEHGLHELRQVTSAIAEVGRQLLEHQPEAHRACLTTDLRNLRGFAHEIATTPWVTRPPRRRRSRSLRQSA